MVNRLLKITSGITLICLPSCITSFFASSSISYISRIHHRHQSQNDSCFSSSHYNKIQATNTIKMSNPNDDVDINAVTVSLEQQQLSMTAAEIERESVARREELLRQILPASQPQEGSPANTFTLSEIEELKAALNTSDLQLIKNPLEKQQNETPTPTVPLSGSNNKIDICDLWVSPAGEIQKEEQNSIVKQQQPQQHQSYTLPRIFRKAVREGKFTGPTNGVCCGYLQCNLVVLPAGPIAFDFLLFCQRNSKACPLLEVCEGATSSFFPKQLAEGADLRTDIPKYAIYRNGELEKEVTDCTDYWPENAVAFLIGCSFSYDGALQNAGIPLKSARAGKNVPMYKTNIACEPAGSLHGNMVVSMKPIPCTMIAKEVEITSKYTHAHGGPVCVGCPSAIGIKDIDNPEWGESIDIDPTMEVPVFHACGVTPQSVLMDSKVPFAITHAAGHMFVTDKPSDMGIL